MITAETSEQDEHEKISTKIHLGNIEEEVKQVDRFEERESSPIVMDQTSNILNDLEMIQMPSEVEYGPPKEKELAYEPAVSIDVSEFSELLPDITAYEYKNDMENEAIQLVDDQDDEDLLMIYTTKWMASITTENHDDTTTEGKKRKKEEFELLDNLDQDPFFTNEETEQDPELLFANHLFNVDEYINQQQQQQQIIC
ncbi:hypothetical protein BDA99DRAFT_170912 [Phascolomyces articulosus]|uniref:Uncharacterized protein n=1 Tax=Phascolomyces articulosus TaxID=60185 RepID=A0AAD5JT84_9FUNG|nr:hypothetical protein BDA99DRAFT_170912 [Phascolomyces articulosus]